MSWWRRLLARLRVRLVRAEAVEARLADVEARSSLIEHMAHDLAQLPPEELADRFGRALQLRPPHPLVEHIDRRLSRRPPEEEP